MCHQSSAHELGSPGGFCPVSKRLSGKRGSSSTQAAPAGKPFAVPQGSLHCAFPHLCVRQLSHGLQAVRIEDPAPKRCLNTRFSSPPHTLPPSCRNQAASSTENLSLPAGEPGDHHTLPKQLEFTAHRELHCSLCSNNSTPRLLARQFSEHGLRGFKGLKRFLSSVPLERDAAALPSASTRSRTASS